MYEYVKSCGEVLSVADHVACDRGFYTHHCIYLGGGIAIHLTLKGIVTENIDDLVGRQSFWVIKHNNAYSTAVIVKRAKSGLYKNRKYNLIFNNCEHFCRWCCTGHKWSDQVFGTLVVGWQLGPLGHILGQFANGGCQKYRLRR